MTSSEFRLQAAVRFGMKSRLKAELQRSSYEQEAFAFRRARFDCGRGSFLGDLE